MLCQNEQRTYLLPENRQNTNTELRDIIFAKRKHRVTSHLEKNEHSEWIDLRNDDFSSSWVKLHDRFLNANLVILEPIAKSLLLHHFHVSCCFMQLACAFDSFRDEISKAQKMLRRLMNRVENKFSLYHWFFLHFSKPKCERFLLHFDAFRCIWRCLLLHILHPLMNLAGVSREKIKSQGSMDFRFNVCPRSSNKKRNFTLSLALLTFKGL